MKTSLLLVASCDSLLTSYQALGDKKKEENHAQLYSNQQCFG